MFKCKDEFTLVGCSLEQQDLGVMSLSHGIAPGLAGCRRRSDKKVGIRNVEPAIATTMVLAVSTNGWLDQGRTGGVDIGGDAAGWAGLFGWKSSTVACRHRAVAAHSLRWTERGWWRKGKVTIQSEASVGDAMSVQGSVAGTRSYRGREKDENGWSIYADHLGIFRLGERVPRDCLCGVQVGPGPQFG